MRRAAKVDQNQAAIVAALRRCGASVQHLHQIGKDCPDLLVGFRGRNFVVEVKDANGTLTPGQAKWMSEWRGQSCVVRTAEEAILTVCSSK